MKPQREIVFKEIEKLAKADPNLSILDLGAGDASFFYQLLNQFPHLHYLGLEPHPDKVAKGNQLLSRYSDARLAEDLVPPRTTIEDKFDVVISLSVLEHVKDLKEFLCYSAGKLKDGGRLIHLYDLGHFYDPKQWKRVWASKLPLINKLVPYSKFVKFVDKDKVVKILENCGVKVEAADTYGEKYPSVIIWGRRKGEV